MAPPTLPTHLIGLNTKAYFDLPTTLSYIRALTSLPPTSPQIGIFILPSHPTLSPAADILKSHSHILLGAQNCHNSDTGPHTGEVSPLLLKQLGCSLVLLGHAERRAPPYNESDEFIAEKAAAVCRNDMIPIICIGEKSRSTSGIASEAIGLAVRECTSQIRVVLEKVPKEAPLVFAYEPVWAIGASEPAGGEHVVNVVKGLRAVVEKEGGKRDVRIIYGGSAGPGTWEDVREGVEGLFLGRFAHQVERFGEVVREIEEGL